MKKHRIILVFCSSLGVLLLLFVAGVAVPSLLYSSHAVTIPSTDSLRNLDIAGISFSFRLQNIAAAFLGVLFGATVALFLASPGHAERGASSWVTALRDRNHSGLPC
jgi:hypothetical protein